MSTTHQQPTSPNKKNTLLPSSLNTRSTLPTQLEGMNILDICNWLVDHPQIVELASKMLVAKSSTHDEMNLDLSCSNSKGSFTPNEVSVILIVTNCFINN